MEEKKVVYEVVAVKVEGNVFLKSLGIFSDLEKVKEIINRDTFELTELGISCVESEKINNVNIEVIKRVLDGVKEGEHYFYKNYKPIYIATTNVVPLTQEAEDLDFFKYFRRDL